jgi:putative endonuclease
MGNKYILYILKCSDSTLYTGITNDLDHRMQMHKEGKGSKYVRARLPFNVVYTEELKDRSEALKREHEIKQMTREEKLALTKLK